MNTVGDVALSDFYENPDTYLVQTGRIERPGLNEEKFASKIEDWKNDILVLKKVKYLKEVETEKGPEYRFLLPYVVELKSPDPEIGVTSSFLAHHLVKLSFQVKDENIEYSFYDIGDEYNAREGKKELGTRSKVEMKTHDYKYTKYFKRGVLKHKGYVSEFKIEELKRFKRAINRLVKSLDESV